MLLCLPLAVLAFIPASFGAQVPLLPVAAQSTTLIDALSADANYTRLLRLLQRSRLVPVLNRLNGSTFFAPTNDAIKQHALWSAASNQDTHLADNIHEALRQQLFYHLLNYSVSSPPSGASVQVFQTLHFPRVPVQPPSKNPPPNPPWLPLPGGSLGGVGQRLRWASRDNATWIGTDYAGAGGVQVVRPKVDAGNGILYGIGGILEPPSNLSYIVAQHPGLLYANKLFPPALKHMIATEPQLTLFLPQDAAWDTLDPLERKYLESGFANDDLQRILGMHSVANTSVLYSDTFNASNKVTTVSGDKLTISVKKNTTRVSSATLVQPDVYAANGVLHLVSDLLLTPGALQLTPEKYLIALNCTAFVRLLRSTDLSGLVNTTNATYTILAPRDDVITLGGDDTLPKEGTAALKRMLRYHFLPGQWTVEKMKDGMLVETALTENGLNGGKQVLNIGVKDGELTFGGAGVIGEPVQVNNTLIYLITRPLIPPVDVLQMALPSLQFSTFLASVFSTSLAQRLKNASRTTLLIPQNKAFEDLGLVTTHLLSSSSKGDLERVILHHALTDVVYLDALVNGSQKTYGTLAGSDVRITRNNGSAWVTPSGGWNGLQAQVVGGNVLAQTGAIHEVANVLLPRSVDITLGKLARAAGGTTMAGLVVKAGLAAVLNGTGDASGWTLLCPRDDSFKGVNMTALWEDEEGMRRLVAQHLIPGVSTSSTSRDDTDANRPIDMDGSASYGTLLSQKSEYGDIVFRPADKGNPQGGYVVGIKGARGTNGANDWAAVLGWGRSTTGTGTSGGGVVQIDRLLVPYQPAWWVAYGPAAGVGVVGVLVIAVFFWVVAYFWRKETLEATYEPVGGFDREDED